MKGEKDAPPFHGFRVEFALFANFKASPLELLVQACRSQVVNEKKILYGPSDPADAPDLVQADSLAIILNSAGGRELRIDKVRARQRPFRSYAAALAVTGKDCACVWRDVADRSPSAAGAILATRHTDACNG
jgi:hypothetical protein